MVLGLAICLASVAVDVLLDHNVEAAGLLPLTLSKTLVAPGAVITIQGSHWPAPRQLQAAVCGAGFQAVSSDCDLTHAISFGPSDNGTFRALLVVAVPPSPCPCVVMITQVNPSGVERLPITIEGAPSAAVPAPLRVGRPAISISNVRILSSSSWTSWFGTAAPRELLVTVHNDGSDSVRPLVVAGWTQGSGRYVITSPPAKLLGAGRSMQIAAAFSLSTFASGQFLVSGQVTGAGFDRSFVTSTSTTPWGLYFLGMLIAVGILLAVAVLIGRRNIDNSRDGCDRIPDIDYRDQIATLPNQIGALQ
jgi:hypothetical protein